jgi:hypothetical protein
MFAETTVTGQAHQDILSRCLWNIRKSISSEETWGNSQFIEMPFSNCIPLPITLLHSLPFSHFSLSRISLSFPFLLTNSIILTIPWGNVLKEKSRSNKSKLVNIILSIGQIHEARTEVGVPAQYTPIKHNWRRKMPSCGMLCRVAIVGTDITEGRIASIIRVKRIYELGTTVAVATNQAANKCC